MDKMKSVMANIIINGSNLIQFLINLILITHLDYQEMATYYYYLATYTILSVITSFYSSKTFRELALSNAEQNIGGVFTSIVILSVIINTTLTYFNMPFYLFINFLFWHIIDYFNNLLIFLNHPNRLTSVIGVRIIRFIVTLFLLSFQSLNLETFSLYNSTLSLMAFYFINRSLISIRSPYIPKMDKSNLGGFIGDISSTISHNLDNLVMKNIKEFTDLAFSNINYMSTNIKYLSGTFHIITFPFLIKDIKEYGKVRLVTKILHLIIPLFLFILSSIALFYIFKYLNVFIIPNYPILVFGFGMLNIAYFLKTYLISLDYKKPLLLAEFLGIIILAISLIFLLDNQDPYQSYINYILFWTTSYFAIYVLIYLIFKVR